MALSPIQKGVAVPTAMEKIRETSKTPMEVEQNKNQLTKIREDVNSVKPEELKKGGWIDTMA